MANINNSETKSKRFLSWNFVVYPGESLPENWKSILGDMMVAWAISPMHDKDINADGEVKKVHRHLLVSFRSVKSYEQVKDIADKLKSAPPQPCRDTRGMVRYFLHLDNPEKAQYNREDIECGGGFDLETALKATATEEEEILDEMFAFIEEHWITEFFVFNSYVRKERKEWRTILRHNCFYISQHIKSQRHYEKEQREIEDTKRKKRGKI